MKADTDIYTKIKWILGHSSSNPLLKAYEKRENVEPRYSVIRKDIENNKFQETWKEIMSKKQENKNRVLYLHIPYCITKCPYCRFFKYYYKDQNTLDIYIDLLVKEIIQNAESEYIQSRPFNAIYFGGGSPTVLSPQHITKILTTLRTKYKLTNDCEITFETRTFGFTDEKIKACIDNGVNRFSIGVQSFDTSIRKSMGRITPKEELINSLVKLRNLDEAVISTDLIYGLPSQTLEIWENDIRTHIDIGIDALDIYQLESKYLLENFKNVPIKLDLADIKKKAEMYRLATNILRANGYIEENATHWARTLRERNLYTSLTRSSTESVNTDTIAFGVSGNGKVNGHVYINSEGLELYHDQVNNNLKPITKFYYPLESSNLIDDLISQVEIGTISCDLISKRYNINFIDYFKPLIHRWEEIGLIQEEAGYIKLTEAGKFWKANIMQTFVICCNDPSTLDLFTNKNNFHE